MVQQMEVADVFNVEEERDVVNDSENHTRSGDTVKGDEHLPQKEKLQESRQL